MAVVIGAVMPVIVKLLLLLLCLNFNSSLTQGTNFCFSSLVFISTHQRKNSFLVVQLKTEKNKERSSLLVNYCSLFFRWAKNIKKIIILCIIQLTHAVWGFFLFHRFKSFHIYSQSFDPSICERKKNRENTSL